MKFCNRCKISKEFTEFHKRSSKSSGHRGICIECYRIVTNAAYIKNPRVLLSPAQKRINRLASLKKCRQKTKAKNAAKEALRRAHKLNATPKWLSSFQLDSIKNYYDAAEYFRETFGDSIEVDHIIPLKGENVSGLHVPWNLQLLPKLQNMKKGNRLET